MDHHLRPLVPEIKLYIKDFLRKLGEVRGLPNNVILCTIDVVGLYPHIPHNEGLEANMAALSNSQGSQSGGWEGSLHKDVVAFADMVLKSNNFQFNGKHYVQKLGTAIGTRKALSYANIFMDKLESCLLREAEFKPHTWWRYIDDILIIWTEDKKKLRDLLDYLNNVHDAIKFSSKWSRSEIEFSDDC